jgi:hypothetical protein
MIEINITRDIIFSINDIYNAIEEIVKCKVMIVGGITYEYREKTVVVWLNIGDPEYNVLKKHLVFYCEEHGYNIKFIDSICDGDNIIKINNKYGCTIIDMIYDAIYGFYTHRPWVSYGYPQNTITQLYDITFEVPLADVHNFHTRKSIITCYICHTIIYSDFYMTQNHMPRCLRCMSFRGPYGYILKIKYQNELYHNIIQELIEMKKYHVIVARGSYGSYGNYSYTDMNRNRRDRHIFNNFAKNRKRRKNFDLFVDAHRPHKNICILNYCEDFF